MQPLDQAIYDATRGLAEAPAGTRLIALSKGLFTIVDEADFQRVSGQKWNARWSGADWPYAVSSVFARGPNCKVLLHRLIADSEPDMLVDHINTITLDNRRSNLRICTLAQNNSNKKKRSGTKVPFKGVSVIKGRFQAKIGVEYKSIYLGLFETPFEAALAYDAAAKKHFGEFARLNFPDLDAAPTVQLLSHKRRMQQ